MPFQISIIIIIITITIIKISDITLPQSGYALAQLVEALRYKPEDRGFDS
jgi:hypothetical protein